jgi:hypothetical protein
VTSKTSEKIRKFFFSGGTFYEKPKTSKPRTKMESQKNKKRASATEQMQQPKQEKEEKRKKQTHWEGQANPKC